MHTVFEHVTGYSIAETIEEVGAYTNQRQNNPWTVAEQIAEGLERELLSTNGL